jgi:hypothetical protein
MRILTRSGIILILTFSYLIHVNFLFAILDLFRIIVKLIGWIYRMFFLEIKDF